MSSLRQPRKFFSNFNRGFYVLESSEVHTFKIAESTSFKIVHNVPRQDYSPRMWLSYTERGIEITWGGPVNFVNLKRKPINVNIIFSDKIDKNLYKNLYTFIVQTSSEVFLNIQNLENSRNGYKII